MGPDEISTVACVTALPICEDCGTSICSGARCLACSEARRLLPRFLRLIVGRAHVLRMLRDLDEKSSQT